MQATYHESAQDLPISGECDVLVIGGGPAGFIAAVAAARNGAQVTLIERYGCLGGLATGGLVLYMDSLAKRSGQRAIGGLPWEALERCRALGGLAEEHPLAIHADSEVLKVVADDMCLQAGVSLRLHSWAVRAIMENCAVRGVITESKQGREAWYAKVCIDATGDGDLAALAGAAYELHTQAIGLNLKVGGIDRVTYDRFRREQPEALQELHRQLQEQGGYAFWPGLTPHSGAGVYWINILGLTQRHPEEATPAAAREPGNAVEYFRGSLNALDREHLTYAEVTLRRQLWDSLEFHKRHIPGFEDAMLLQFASQLGVRDSRRIRGRAQLNKAEMRAGAHPADTIGQAGNSNCPDGVYRVAYGCLVPETTPGLLVAGRCIWADDYGQQAIRLIPPAMVTGQAAGVAAAMACRAGVLPSDMDIDALRRQLVADDVML
ncbi:MAG: FAD-dependent oxidoreductase [Chloroflexi bacterium]|nr:FAD-dependent oxidoreductase [Chloroflexota bacterium]